MSEWSAEDSEKMKIIVRDAKALYAELNEMLINKASLSAAVLAVQMLSEFHRSKHPELWAEFASMIAKLSKESAQ